MRIGARDSMGKTQVKAFQPHWIDDVAVLIVPPWFLVIAFLVAPSNWSWAAFISGAFLLMIGARAKSAAMGCACAAVA